MTNPNRIINEIELELKNKKIKTSLYLINKLNFIIKKYSQSKNPKILNTINYLLNEIKLMPLKQLKEKINSNINNYLTLTNPNKIVDILSDKIRNGSTIFIYGKPTTAINAAKISKNKKIKFLTITSDSGPEKIGMQAAEELAKNNIFVEHIPDFLIEKALKKADLIMMEAYNLIENKKLVADFGADNIAKLAKSHHIPIYCAFDMFSIDKTGKIKEKDFEKKSTKSNIILVNRIKTTINLEDVKGIVTQEGVFSPQHFKRRIS